MTSHSTALQTPSPDVIPGDVREEAMGIEFGGEVEGGMGVPGLGGAMVIISKPRPRGERGGVYGVRENRV